MKRAMIATALLVASVGCEHDRSEANDTKAVQPGQPAPAPKPAAATPKPAKQPTIWAVPVDGSPFRGPATAKVTIVKAYEYACPYCLRGEVTMEQVAREYGDDVKIVYRNFLVHPGVAKTPALAACAADQQDKFLDMNKLIWDKGFKGERDLSEANMLALARELGLDMDRFESDMKGADCEARVERDQRELARVGTRGTPNFYINGRKISGAQPFEKFKRVIDEELVKANVELMKGADLATYYERFVLEQGKRSI